MDRLKFFWRAVPALMFLLTVVPVAKAQTEKPDKPADTPSKRNNHPDPDTFPAQTIYLTNATQQNDENEITTALRNMLEPWVKIYLVPTQNAIVMRASPEEVEQAQKIIHDLDRPRAEIVVDVVVLNVSKEKMNQLGSGAARPRLLKDKDAHVVQRQSLRATDGEFATAKQGSRIPVATGVTAEKGAPAETRSAIQYLDTGMNVGVTPTVQGDGKVSLKLKIEISAQSGSTMLGSVNGPVIAQRVVEQEVQLRDGEAAILDCSSKDTDPNETVFLVVPHIVSHAAEQSAAAALALNGQ